MVSEKFLNNDPIFHYYLAVLCRNTNRPAAVRMLNGQVHEGPVTLDSVGLCIELNNDCGILPAADFVESVWLCGRWIDLDTLKGVFAL